MSERYKEPLITASLGVANQVREALVEKVMERVSKRGWEALPGAMDFMLKELNIEIVYSDEEEDGFAESRAKLRTEPGIIIANHPGYFDVVSVVKAAYRPDLKIWAGDRGFEIGKKYFGEDHFLETTKDSATNLAQLRTIEEHIRAGGAFMFFPTGGNDMIAQGGGLHFQQGLAVMFRKMLRPTDMVYNFYIEPDDIASIMGQKANRLVAARSGLALGELANLNRLKERKGIRVSEQYSQAGEWQRALEGAQAEDRNEVLTKHFLRKFNSMGE